MLFCVAHMMSQQHIVHMLARENTMVCAPSSGAQNRLLGKRQITTSAQIFTAIVSVKPHGGVVRRISGLRQALRGNGARDPHRLPARTGREQRRR